MTHVIIPPIFYIRVSLHLQNRLHQNQDPSAQSISVCYVSHNFVYSTEKFYTRFMNALFTASIGQNTESVLISLVMLTQDVKSIVCPAETTYGLSCTVHTHL